MNPARGAPERSNGFSIPGPDILPDGISDVGPKPSPACPPSRPRPRNSRFGSRCLSARKKPCVA
ncbi:MAG: hypothetical protein ACREBD_39260, partial [Blastocatellia bacterium]